MLSATLEPDVGSVTPEANKIDAEKQVQFRGSTQAERERKGFINKEAELQDLNT